MNVRFVSWNIHGKNQITPMVKLLHSINADLIALQEVTESAYRTLVQSKLFAWSTFSFDLRPRQVNEGSGRYLGCALLGQASFPYKSSFLLEDAPLPERALIAEVETPTGPLTLCSFHAPPGVRWGEKKPQALLALARWLAQHQTRVIVGMDANTPKSEHLDIEQNKWWWKEEPLAVSYNRGRGKSPYIPCRYDFIYLTPDFSVSEVRYLYIDALQVGSDHALVMADLIHTTEPIQTIGHLFAHYSPFA